MKYFVGVDGGATKSLAVISGPNGEIISQRKGQALNYHAVGRVVCKKNLKKLLQPFFKKYKKIGKVVIGFAGLDTKKDFLVYQSMIKRVLPKKIPFSLLNDAEIALAVVCQQRACRGKAGILIICGTGSSVYGEFKNRKAKAVGWDFILGDEGSAYWFGLSALRKTVMSWDGRGRSTILEKLVLKKSKKRNVAELIPEIYKYWHENPQEFKKYIASFAKLFCRPSLRKDPVAKEIIENAVRELALGVEAVAKRLSISAIEPLCVGFVGSGFRSSGLLPALVAKIKKVHPKVHFIYNVNPLQGAINLAINL